MYIEKKEWRRNDVQCIKQSLLSSLEKTVEVDIVLLPVYIVNLPTSKADTRACDSTLELDDIKESRSILKHQQRIGPQS